MHLGPIGPDPRHFRLRPLQELTRSPQPQMLGQLVVHATGEHHQRGMHAERTPRCGCGPEADLCAVDLNVLDSGRRIQDGTACDRASGQGPVKVPFIDDIGQRLLRGIWELSSMA
jgi:hypothetical protein